jgi:hypothetical protein
VSGARPGRETLADLAALAYDIDAEWSNPSPDMVMRRIILNRLSEVVAALPMDERAWLARRAGR